MHVSSALLYLAAGSCVMLVVLNRWLLDIKVAWHKLPLMVVSLLVFVAVPAAFGLFHGYTAWSWGPAVILGGFVIGEAHRVVLRRRYRGQRAAAHPGRGFSLARPFTTTDLAVAHFQIHLPTWDGSGLRVAHISDLHVNSRLPQSYFAGMWRRIAEAAPDAIFITGDFVSHARELPLLREALAARPRGTRIFAVLGNHDHWSAPDLVSGVLLDAGIELIGNRHQRLAPRGRGGVIVSGCEDPWAGEHWMPPGKAPGEMLLVLSHTPDNIYKLSEAGADAVFSGHYHAGQFRIPRLGSLVIPSLYGRRFDHGHFIVNGSHLFVTAGIGASQPAIRIYCPPDVFIIDITGGRRA